MSVVKIQILSTLKGEAKMTKEQILGIELIRKMENTEKNEEYFEKICCYDYENMSEFEKMVHYIACLEGQLEEKTQRLEGCYQVIERHQQKVERAKKAIKDLFVL